MEISHTILAVVGATLGGILLFTILKGVVRMLLLAIAVVGAVGVWLLLQRNGFTFLSFITPNPRPWMVQTAAWGGGAFVFLVFHHGMRWFSHLFSLKKAGAGSIITTILMSALMLWLITLGISYYGDIRRISYYHDLALAQQSGENQPEIPWICRVKDELRKSHYTAWLEKIDPMEDPAQTNLACLVAYGCALNETHYNIFYRQQLATRNIPQPTRFLDLFGDAGLRTLVAEKRYVTLLENERLKTFVQFRNTEEIMRGIL